MNFCHDKLKWKNLMLNKLSVLIFLEKDINITGCFLYSSDNFTKTLKRFLKNLGLFLSHNKDT